MRANHSVKMVVIYVEKQNRNRIKLNREAIKDANHINIYILFACSLMAILSELLNELGIFTMDKVIMRITISIVFVLFVVIICNKFL